jgi:hypothetical protein
MHVVGLDVHRFRVGFMLRDGHKGSEVDFLAVELKKAAHKFELLAVYFAQHLADLAALRKRLLDVDTLRFLEVDVDNHPVSVSPGLEIIKVDALEPQEFKNLIFVNILRHMTHDMLLERSKLNNYKSPLTLNNSHKSTKSN